MVSQEYATRLDITFLGTADAAGVPRYGCDCPACQAARNDARLRRSPCCAEIRWGRAGREQRLLIDAGLADLGRRYPSGTLQRLLLTHFHVDHVQGLFTLRWGNKPGITVMAPDDPSGCADLLKHPGLLDFSRCARPFEGFVWDGLEITPLPLNHSKPTLGYYLCYGGQRLAYLTDTLGLPEDTERFLRGRGCDLLVLDSCFAPGQRLWGQHNDLDEALGIVRRIQPAQCRLTHVSCGLLNAVADQHLLPGGVALAEDGLCLSLPLS